MNYSEIRREKLARYLAEGLPITIACKKAGFIAANAASIVAREPGVQARVAEIVNQGLPETLRTSGELDTMLDELLDADVRLYFDENGRTINPHDLRNAEAMALTGYKEGKYGPELKFESKLSVLNLAMKRRGMLIDKQEISGPNGTPLQTINSEMSASDAAELYRSMLG